MKYVKERFCYYIFLFDEMKILQKRLKFSEF